MNTKIIVGGIIGAVVMFLLGGLIYLVILKSIFPMPEEPEMMMYVWIFVANLAMGLLLAYVFGRWANISTIQGGLMGALVIGLLVAITFDSYMMAFGDHEMTVTILIVDIIATTVITMCGGAVIGWYNGMGKTAAAE